MPIKQTPIEGLFIFEPKVFEDERGYFFESFNAKVFEEVGVTRAFVQDNRSKSKYGTLRGLHFQKGEFAQAKLVSVLKGSVLDVAVDLRQDSSTFGEHFSIELTAANKKQLYVPRGFAHGFVVLEDDTEFFYKCDNFYSPQNEGGIIYNDPQINIDWKVADEDIVLSNKDKINPTLADYEKQF